MQTPNRNSCEVHSWGNEECALFVLYEFVCMGVCVCVSASPGACVGLCVGVQLRDRSHLKAAALLVWSGGLALDGDKLIMFKRHILY